MREVNIAIVLEWVLKRHTSTDKAQLGSVAPKHPKKQQGNLVVVLMANKRTVPSPSLFYSHNSATAEHSDILGRAKRNWKDSYTTTQNQPIDLLFSGSSNILRQGSITLSQEIGFPHSAALHTATFIRIPRHYRMFQYTPLLSFEDNRFRKGNQRYNGNIKEIGLYPT
jgi:hypothetical protein